MFFRALGLIKYHHILAPTTFNKLSYYRLATPQLIRKILRVPVAGMSRKAKFSLYQGKNHMTKVQTCFSEHKTNVKVSPNVFRKVFHSKVLGCRIKTTVTSTAYRTIRKYGGFDNYITCMNPKVMRSPYGNYLQTLMLRKIQNPQMLVPYVLKSKQLKKIRSRDYVLRKIPRVIMPVHPDKYYNPDPFGERIEEMDDAQYEKHMELEKLSKKREDIDNTHPLIKELNAKLEVKRDPEAEAVAEKAREEYLNQKKDRKARKKMYLEHLREDEEYMQKMLEEQYEKEGAVEEDEQDEQKQNEKFYNYLDKLEHIKKEAQELDKKENKKMKAKMKKDEPPGAQEQEQKGKKGKKSKKQKDSKKKNKKDE